MAKIGEQQAPAESKALLVEQINACLHSGDYSRATELLRGAKAFPNDSELSELEKLAQDGVQRKAEAQRLITESQELFAQQKPAEAIQVLRRAYELNKNNALARTILANALVEHAQSIVETDWLQAETLTNQALALNPAHPTAKTILSLIVYQKKTSSVEDWVAQATKLQSSGDLFAALAWVAEGLAVHQHDPKLLLIQDAIQRDQEARRRQTRRRDLEELRRMENEIDGATDAGAKQALAQRIQGAAAKHWTDGEILFIANGLLQRLGLVSQESSTRSPHTKSSTLIFHVPRSSAPKPSPDSPIPASDIPPNPIPPNPSPQSPSLRSPFLPAAAGPGPLLAASVSATDAAPIDAAPSEAPPSSGPPSIRTPNKVPPTKVLPGKVYTSPKQKLRAPKAVIVPAAEQFITTAKFTAASEPRPVPKSNFTGPIVISAAAAIILFAAVIFYARKTTTPPAAKNSPPALAVSAPATSSSAISDTTAPTLSATPRSAAAQTIPEPAPAASLSPSDNASARTTAPEPRTPSNHPVSDAGSASTGNIGTESGRNLGTLLVVAGQDNAKVFLNGRPQTLLTQAGQLRIPNLDFKDYVVQVSKSGFQDPPPQKIRIRNGEQARLVFNFQPEFQPQPQPRLASLTIRAGPPGTTVFVDQALVGTIQPDGTLSVSNVNPGDHIVELRKDRFKPRQLKEHFATGGVISIAGADAALEAVPGELKIRFAPADAKVAIVKGDSLTMVSSGVPLNLAAGTYTLTARTADRFTRSSTFDVIAGQSKTLDLSLAPNGMSNWEDPAGWKQEKDSFIHKGGDFVLYGVVPASGTFIFSAMPAKGHLLQWVVNYIDAKNYILFQLDDTNFYRTVIRNGAKTDEIKVPDRGEKKSFRSFHVRVSSTEIVHEIKNGEGWTVVDRWTQPGANFGSGKFGFYLPGNDQVILSGFAHYADLNVR